MFKLFLFILVPHLLVDQVQSITKVQFIIKLGKAKMELDCKFTMGSGEKHTGLSISKDGQVFLEYKTQDNPKNTNITGITLVNMHGGCNVHILNYNPDSMGIYELQIKYKTKSGKSALAQKYLKTSMKCGKPPLEPTLCHCNLGYPWLILYQQNLSNNELGQKDDKCTPNWVDANQDSDVSDAYIAAIRVGGSTLVICKNTVTDNENDRVGYFEKGTGCVFTFGGVGEPLKEFQILTGTGFQWAIQDDINKLPPNAFKIGHETFGDIYIGRCNFDGSAFIGKITNGFYFNHNGNEISECPSHDILVC